MAKQHLDEARWREIALLRPASKAQRRSYAGSKAIHDGLALTGIVFMLTTAGDLPRELGCGRGMSCWWRMREWPAAGAWDRLQTCLIERLDRGGKSTGLARVAVNSISVRADFRRRRSNSTSRLPLAESSGLGSQSPRPLQSLPFVVRPAPAHAPKLPARMPIGPSTATPLASACSRKARITPCQEQQHSWQRLGLPRSVLERSISWLYQIGGLRIRYQLHDHMHRALLSPAASMIAARHLSSFGLDVPSEKRRSGSPSLVGS